MSEELKLKVGRTYRGKRPVCVSIGLVNDRTVKWLGAYEVQFDGPAVPHGRHFPRVTIEAFLKWAERDVTDELPPGDYAKWPPEVKKS